MNISECYPFAITATGYDDCILGMHHKQNGESVVAYNRTLILEKLAKEMTYEEAEEYFEFNIAGAYMGEGTPIFIEPMEL